MFKENNWQNKWMNDGGLRQWMNEWTNDMTANQPANTMAMMIAARYILCVNGIFPHSHVRSNMVDSYMYDNVCL